MKILITICAFFFSVLVSATPLKNIVIFGDSLSDNGNLYRFMQDEENVPPGTRPQPESPPYYKGHFSNGPVWIEQLAEALFPENPESYVRNYARGGAAVSEKDSSRAFMSLDGEIATYLFEHNDKASEDTLFIVWIGSNNYLPILDNPDQAVADVNKGLERGLKRLVDQGAKHILLLNLADLGKSPFARQTEAQRMLTYLCRKHNKALLKSVGRLQKTYPQVQWLHYNVNELVNTILTTPATYGFSNIQDTCKTAEGHKPKMARTLLSITKTEAQEGAEVDACDGYLFFDPVHPTTVAHRYMANKALEIITEAGIEFVKPETTAKN